MEKGTKLALSSIGKVRARAVEPGISIWVGGGVVGGLICYRLAIVVSQSEPCLPVHHLWRGVGNHSSIRPTYRTLESVESRWPSWYGIGQRPPFCARGLGSIPGAGDDTFSRGFLYAMAQLRCYQQWFTTLG